MVEEDREVSRGRARHTATEQIGASIMHQKQVHHLHLDFLDQVKIIMPERMGDGQTCSKCVRIKFDSRLKRMKESVVGPICQM